ncbi:deoxyuridine triphosphatase [Human alphaherpesvirus 3]|uniref:ORF8 n=1 Tax=Human herpesvirus 3 TaxID=10335 RepID=A0A0F7CV30_HHV3|nr:ORF8 [Human alphaherpesvirus 3]AQT34059.1 deoxyuridine triphosphatase [Human alphaherpesvirus 3]QCA42925.1 ORF8 [Human alphaherpesvirus 3]WKR23781.1 deoxyuridine triphosphatase [Human alphaherpesvirus 3]
MNEAVIDPILETAVNTGDMFCSQTIPNRCLKDTILIEVQPECADTLQCVLDDKVSRHQPLLLRNHKKLELPSEKSVTRGGFYMQQLELLVKSAPPNEYALLLIQCKDTALADEDNFFVANGVIDAGYRGVISALLYYRPGVTVILPGHLTIYLFPVKLRQSRLLPKNVLKHLDPIFKSIQVQPLSNSPSNYEKPVIPEFADISTVQQGQPLHRDSAEYHIDVPLTYKHIINPKRQEDAGYDICVPYNLYLKRNEFIKIVLPIIRDWDLQHPSINAYIFGRSSKSRSGIIVCPTAWPAGEHCKFYVYNLTGDDIRIRTGDRLAQVLLIDHNTQIHLKHNVLSNIAFPYAIRGKCGIPGVQWYFTKTLDLIATPSERGTRGFGSTDKETNDVDFLLKH